eukprot:TRINITY_DN62145_c0_g1_i1.p1 TRINITY_DN62145_c0_g1~~TRINITY_DN62145_c0_g1_i1.p1  ORF type:complete len:493 (-),score=122.39 TRINITY_DN62145_c0_g1_i1:26-1504(-)
MAEGGYSDSMREMLSAKGYDIVGPMAGEDSDSDEDPFGRIPKLEPDVAREKGKKAFNDGKYDKAIKYWQGGLKSILSALCAGPEALSNQNLSELDLTLNLNIAMAYMKKSDFEAAERSVEKALARREALPPQLVTKALYRKASAQRSMHRLDHCLETLKDLLEVEAGHAAAKQMQQEVEREWAKQCRDQKKNLRKLFDRMSGEDKKQEENDRQRRSALRERCAVRWTEDDVNSEAFSLGEAPACDGRDWGLALSRTVLWSVEQLMLEGCDCLSQEVSQATFWFVGASSTCELRWLRPTELLRRMPSLQCLELELIGFLGEIDPDNSRVPDPKASSLPEGISETNVDGGRRALLRATKGSMEEAVKEEVLPPRGSDGQQALPTVCFIAHPQLHRYFTEFHPAVSWLIERRIPTVVIGASEPDPSWKQDEQLLRKLGADLIVSKRESPYPMCLPDNPDVKKCSHIIAFRGGKAVEKDNLMNVKLELLAQDYSVR